MLLVSVIIMRESFAESGIHWSYPQAFFHDAVDIRQVFEIGKSRHPIRAAESIQFLLSLFLDPRMCGQKHNACAHSQSTGLSSGLHQSADKVGKFCSVKGGIELGAFIIE